jgi:acetyl esterase/lipase
VSARADLLRISLRWLGNRNSRADNGVDKCRRRADFINCFLPKAPRRIVTRKVDAGGVSADCVVSAASERDRHILYLHGGGYVLGSPMLYRDLTWRIAKRACARILCIDYRLAPEHPFPAAVDDTVAAYRWLVACGADPRRIVIMGDSAGGGLALAALLKLRDEGAVLPAATVALSPWTDLALTGPSLKRNARPDAIFGAGDWSWTARCYLAGIDPRTPYASPLYGNAAGLPPTLIQVSNDEMLLDDSVRMADKLRAAGCEVELEIWPRMPHGWHLFAKLLPEARQAIERIGTFVRARA